MDALAKEQNGTGGRAARDSGVELLKVIAIFLIVVSHVLQTLDGPMSLDRETADPWRFSLSFFRYTGFVGNMIFFVSSAWFLVDRDATAKRKLLRMVVDIWTVSVLILAAVLAIRGGNVAGDKIFASLLPTTASNNWFLTCYLLFCLAHPFLNLIIRNVDQRGLLRIVLAMTGLYFVLSIAVSYHFWNVLYQNDLIVWIAVYFIVAYFKKYARGAAESTKANVLVLLSSVAGLFLLVWATNFSLLRDPFSSDGLLRWIRSDNLFFVLIAFSSLNLARKWKFHSVWVNRVSGLSLLIYIIHENLLLREYYRYPVWQAIFRAFGTDRAILWALPFAAALFLAVLLVSALYALTVQRATRRFADWLCGKLEKGCARLEDRLLRIR